MRGVMPALCRRRQGRAEGRGTTSGKQRTRWPHSQSKTGRTSPGASWRRWCTACKRASSEPRNVATSRQSTACNTCVKWRPRVQHAWPDDGDKTVHAARRRSPHPRGVGRDDPMDAVHEGNTTMTQRMHSRSDQRTVIGRTPAGSPRTYRLMRARSRSARVVLALRKLLP